MNRFLFLLLTLSCFIGLFSQKVTIQGEVYDEYLTPFPDAKVKDSDGNYLGTSDIDGLFTIKVNLPILIKIEAEGFAPEKIMIDSEEAVSLILKEQSELDVVVSAASRTSEKVFESPVSIRTLGSKDIIRSTAKDFYNALADLPEVNMYNQSTSLQVLNTRGLTYAKNFRFIQLVDGMDNMIPADNMYGNLVGAIELDVNNIEVLPGASSALYGSNAFNGAMIVSSKQPFEHDGVSIKTTAGIMSNFSKTTDGKSKSTPNSFYGLQARFSYRFNDYFAASVSASMDLGDEWRAEDYRGRVKGIVEDENGVDKMSPNYDGVNVYGDELSGNLRLLGYSNYLNKIKTFLGKPNFLIKAKEAYEVFRKIPSLDVRRTGYKENELISNKYKNRKLHTTLHLRPLKSDKLNIIIRSKLNVADPFIFHGVGGRYEESLFNNAHLLEVNGDNYFVRGYYSGFDMNYRSIDLLGTLINQEHKKDVQWLKDFGAAYIKSGNAKMARDKADVGRYIPGTTRFKSLKAKFNSKLLGDGGTVSLDKSSFRHYEGNINLNKYIGWDILFGATYRNYLLDSEGSLYSDKKNDYINMNEYGAYTKVKRSFFDDRLAIQTSLRVDDTKNYKPQFSPRLSSSYTLGEDRNHNIRCTVQTAFRNPSIQDQYFAYDLGVEGVSDVFTFGNSKDNLNRLQDRRFKGVRFEDLIGKSGFTKSSYSRYSNLFLKSVQDGSTPDQMRLKAAEYAKGVKDFSFKDVELTSEKIRTISVGYRGMLSFLNNILEIDVSGYFNQYKDFLTNETIHIPLSKNADASAEKKFTSPETLEFNPFMKTFTDIRTRNAVTFSGPINSDDDLNTFGSVVNVKTKIFDDFDISVNYSWAIFEKTGGNDTEEYNRKEYDTDRFNMPEHNVKIMFGKRNLFRNLGFNIAYKYQNRFVWNSDFINGYVPSQNLVDAQITYVIPKLSSRFKLGFNNLLMKDYVTNLGVGQMGSTAFLSWTIND